LLSVLINSLYRLTNNNNNNNNNNIYPLILFLNINDRRENSLVRNKIT
jgi:hypothetical protein